jgi:hypothetical protein
MHVLQRCAIDLCFLAPSSFAQNDAATLTGRVQDITDEGATGAQIELRSETSGKTFPAQANGSGVYYLSGLAADVYTVKLGSPDF